MSVPTEVTKLEIEEELGAAEAWAERHQIPFKWIEDRLELQVVLTQPESKDLYYLKGVFDDYKEMPPKWIFTDSNWSDEIKKQNFPKGESTPFGSSMFHPNGVICAPFNRLAYKVYDGPHSDWGSPAQWLNAARDKVVADTMGDMLSAIYRDFRYTKTHLS
ncbi:hypothetical protein [Fodinibius salsisoli]|uniref:hypothetical protein n=1 Tax=Fodinibius salsisoli TaxID=2820877 RepID=UPI0022481652|nr:hypothetical protein [Fodinibius salsisoli]